MTTQSQSGRPFAVVTGASSGIGFHLAKEFARNGYDVLAAADDDGLEAAAAALREAGADAVPVRVNLAERSGVDRLAAAIAQLGRPVDAIAINAGVGVGGDFRTTDLDAELRLIDLNCKSTVALAKAVVPAMTERGSGRVLFTASIAAIMGDPFEAVYGASKAFVRTFALSLRNELKDTGVSVTALMPGPTDTNFFDRAGMQDTKIGNQQKDDPADVARQGYDALMAGKDEIVAGSLQTKIQAAVVRPFPETVGANLHRSIAEPGSAGR